MRWFRSQRRTWGWMALLALVLQLGLSFGHVHGLHADRAAAWTVSTQPDAGPASSGDDGDYCATCAILTMLGGAQTASTPVFVLPVALVSAEIAAVPQAARVILRRAAFHSRAPPLS
jgi:hypothetical protein